VTAGRQSNLRAQFYANFKHQLSLPQNDVGEVRSIVGSTPLAKMMEDIKGRALMKRDEVDVIQLALPVAGANDAQVLNNLRQEVASLQEAWTGQRPSAIPMVPEELTEADFYSRASVQAAYEQGLVPLGLDMETVEPITWNLSKGNLLYLTDRQEYMLDFVSQLIHGKQKVIIFAPKHHGLQIENGVDYLTQEEEYVAALDTIKDRIEGRLERRAYEHVATVIIYDWVNLVQELSLSNQNKLLYVLEKGARVGYASIVISDSNLSRQIDEVSRLVKTYKQSLMGIRFNDQTIVTATNKPPMREGALDAQIHYYTVDSLTRKLKVLMK
jgi:conserved protein 163